MAARSGRILADLLREELQIEGTPTGQLSEIFEREPVPLRVFITDKSYLGNPPLSPLQFEFVANLEQILLPETYIALVEQLGSDWMPLPMKHMLVAEWGKGSGKDHCCRMGATRAADLLMCLRNPQRYYGMPEQDDIHIINVAASADQARRAFFAPMKRLFVTNSLLSQHFRNDNPPAEMATSILLKKNVEMISGHSMAETQEGLNPIVGIADEISAFKTRDELARAGMVAEGREAKTAEGIVKMLRTSARTRFPRCFKVAQISFPRFVGDAIEQAMDIGRRNNTRYGADSQYFVMGPYATWEVNPRVSDKSAFQDDYDEDPEMAAAMYECKPPKAVNRFIRNDVAIGQAFSRSIPDPVMVEYYWGLPEKVVENPNAPAERVGWQVRFGFHPDLLPMDGAAYALHGDLAITGDRAGVAMTHIRTNVERKPNPEADIVELRPVVRNDFVFSFESDLTATSPDGVLAPREVQIRWYRQLVWELVARGFYVASATFDGFQSVDMIQVFNSRGINSKIFSLDRTDAGYQTLKDVINDGRLEGYYRLRVKTEVETLRVVSRNGTRKIDHPPKGSKDESDALAGSIVGAIEVGGDEGEEPLVVDTTEVALYGTSGRSSAMPGGSALGFGEAGSFASVGDLSTLGFG